MKVLWLCNVVLSVLRDEFGFKKDSLGSWSGNMLAQLNQTYDDIEYGICCPIYNEERMKDGISNGISFFSFHFADDISALEELEKRFCTILNMYRPDVIHIWGMEYIHSTAMVNAAIELGYIDRTRATNRR